MRRFPPPSGCVPEASPHHLVPFVWAVTSSVPVIPSQTIGQEILHFGFLKRSDAFLFAEVNKPYELSWQFFRAACRAPAVGQLPPALRLGQPTRDSRAPGTSSSLPPVLCLVPDGDSSKPEPELEPRVMRGRDCAC